MKQNRDLVNLFMNKNLSNVQGTASLGDCSTSVADRIRPKQKISGEALTEKERQVHTLLSKADKRTTIGLGIKRALDKRSPREFRKLILEIKSLAKENLISVNEWIGKDTVKLINEL